MDAVRFSADVDAKMLADTLREHGYAIVENLASAALMDQISEEMKPHIDLSPSGADDFTGRKTRRTGAMIARSPAARQLVMNRLALDTTADVLSKAFAFQLHLTQVISVFPESPAQKLHQDQLAWDFFPFPDDYEVHCGLLWAMSDFTAEMGATRVVPGSHKGNKKSFTDEDTVVAEMPRGSALFYTGKVYHGAGANLSDRIRQAISIAYSVGWLRQEENQYLATPLEIARTLPDDLLKLMGYQMGSRSLGYVRDYEDPLQVLRHPDQRVAVPFPISAFPS